jgi:hypothetical protein
MGRLGGNFPFPIAQVAEGGTRITLGSGGVYVLPANQYLIITDGNSVVQYWDPQAGVWQTLVGHSSFSDITADGCNYRILNDSGTLGQPVVAGPNNSTGYTNGIGPVQTGITIGVPASPTASMTGSAYAIVGGVVGTPTVTQTGSGFQSPPLVVIDPPPVGGIQAVAHANLTAGGGIASITVDQGGAGYQTSPNFWLAPMPPYYTGAPSAGGAIAASPFPPGGIVAQANALPGNQNIGTGAAGALITPVALTGSGVIQAVRIVNFGGLYVGAQTLTVNGGGGTIGTTTVTSTPPGAVAVATVILSPRINQ